MGIVWDLLFGFLYFGNPFGRQFFLAEGSLLSSLPFFFGFWLHLFDCCFGSCCVRVLRASTRGDVIVHSHLAVPYSSVGGY